MVRLNHLSIPVADCRRSRDWYVTHFGFKVEFEVSERRTVALNDDGDMALFLYEPPAPFTPGCTLMLQVDDVEGLHARLASQGIAFEKAPQKLFWSYGAELRDPDGYMVYLWDEATMRDKG